MRLSYKMNLGRLSEMIELGGLDARISWLQGGYLKDDKKEISQRCQSKKEIGRMFN